MKAVMETTKLREALKRVNMVNINKQLPILASTHIDFSNGKATLTTTDMQRVVRVSIECDNLKDFTTVLPRKSIAPFLHGKNGSIAIEQKSSHRQITLSREGLGVCQLFDLPNVGDFPPIPQSDNLQWHTLDAKWFCRMLKIVSSASADEDTRPTLYGVAFYDGVMLAADGFRFVIFKNDGLVFGLGDKQGIIPLDTIKILLRLFSKEDSVDIAFDITEEQTGFNTTLAARRVHIKSDNTYLLSELVQGNYPNYNVLIPDKYTCGISFSAPLMSQRINMVDWVSMPGNIMRFIFEKNKITNEHICTLRAKDGNLYDYSFTLPVKITSNDVGKIAFNANYILDTLKPFSVCNLEISSASSPGKFTGDIEGLTIVVMPMWAEW